MTVAWHAETAEGASARLAVPEVAVLAVEPRPSWTATAEEDAVLDRDLALTDIFDMDQPKVMQTAYTSRLGRVLLHLAR